MKNSEIYNLIEDFNAAIVPREKAILGLKITGNLCKQSLVGEGYNVYNNDFIKYYQDYNQMIPIMSKSKVDTKDLEVDFNIGKKGLNFVDTSKNYKLNAFAKIYFNIFKFDDTEYKVALNYLYKSLDICFHNKFVDIIFLMYKNIANFNLITGDHQIVIDYLQKGINIADKIDIIADLLLNIANSYRVMLDRKNAIEYYKKAAKKYKEINDIYGVLVCYFSIARLDIDNYFYSSDYNAEDDSINEKNDEKIISTEKYLNYIIKKTSPQKYAHLHYDALVLSAILCIKRKDYIFTHIYNAEKVIDYLPISALKKQYYMANGDYLTAIGDLKNALINEKNLKDCEKEILDNKNKYLMEICRKYGGMNVYNADRTKELKEDNENHDNVIPLKTHQSLIGIDSEDIMYIESRKNYLHLYLKNVIEPIVVRGCLTNLEVRLDNRFLRCSRSYIVNMAYIFSINKNSIVLKNSLTIKCSRNEKDLKDKYLNWTAKNL
jgi:tetratricopeptide (TPR) repeat protein